ncbi:hypothetical protein EVAR_92442_1 [Eumeta japonica]|uniref:Uncharacterized protein n=1 Tax=Eumeta variegata TaxID=151549 RepID=A0A4C1T6S4_EUMVA|nr:hypothetical protein EVAR_92442_1 [Eumeta japonica]
MSLFVHEQQLLNGFLSLKKDGVLLKMKRRRVGRQPQPVSQTISKDNVQEVEKLIQVYTSPRRQSPQRAALASPTVCQIACLTFIIIAPGLEVEAWCYVATYYVATILVWIALLYNGNYQTIFRISLAELKSAITNYKQVYKENRDTTYDLPIEWENKGASQEYLTSNELIDIRPLQPARTEARPYWFRDRSDGRRYVALSNWHQVD